MKKLSFLLFVMLTSSLVFAQKGINFQHDKSWSDILTMAKKADKLIFVDAYTTWCGPCKKMTRNIFTQKSVGKFYNTHFINVKMDVEKGEGIAFLQKYKVNAYPTLLFINGEGALVQKVTGYMAAEEFLSLGEGANDPNQALFAMDAKYEAGERSVEFLKTYTEAKFKTTDGSHSVILDEYLNTQDDWSTSENMEFIFQFVGNVDSRAFDYIINNSEAFQNHFGESELTQKVRALTLFMIFHTKPSMDIDKIKGIIKKYFIVDKKVSYFNDDNSLYAIYEMKYYLQLGDGDKYAKASIAFLEHTPKVYFYELHEMAWNFFLLVDDKVLLEKALGWAKKSVKKKKYYENVNTVAHLYYKLGNKENAVHFAEKSIKVGKKNGDDTATTKELLEKIAGME